MTDGWYTFPWPERRGPVAHYLTFRRREVTADCGLKGVVDWPMYQPPQASAIRLSPSEPNDTKCLTCARVRELYPRRQARVDRMMDMRAAGQSLEEIGRTSGGISREAVRKMLLKEEHRRRA